MPAASQAPPDLLGLSPGELEAFLQTLGRVSRGESREPRYRARQLFSWLHRGASFDQMSDLPEPLRGRLAQTARAGTLRVVTREEAPDGSARFAFRTDDGHLIETVLIPHRARTTVCVSSQIGCAFGCGFCATGKQGLTRSLRAGEMVEQVVRVQSELGGRQAPVERAGRRRVTNVVFMGMGEPLANYDAVLKAVALLNDERGLRIGARHIAISTCGLPDQIRRLAGEGIQLALAISLHGATDAVRERLVPIGRKHSIAQVMAAARYYVERTGRKVVFAYVVVPGVNDTPEQATRLAALLRGLPSVVNVIPRNPLGEASRPDPDAAFRFARLLQARGLSAVVRRSRGAEVLGACGQLSSRRQRADTAREAQHRATRQAPVHRTGAPRRGSRGAR
jgi:23S rRNA (adenine2503-C2)-methyltransferase